MRDAYQRTIRLMGATKFVPWCIIRVSNQRWRANRAKIGQHCRPDTSNTRTGHADEITPSSAEQRHPTLSG